MNQPVEIDDVTQSKPLRQRLLPQTSIRFVLLLISLCALVMVVLRSAVAGAAWAKIGSLLIVTVVGCFLLYAVLFLIANVFSATIAPIARGLESSKKES